MLEWLPSALPITVGPYGFELVSFDAEGVRLKFFGLERYRGDADRPAFMIETGFGFSSDARFDLAARAWLAVVREVFEAAAQWPRETERWLGPHDVCGTHLFEKVLKKKATRDEAAFLDAWRLQFRELLPPTPQLLDAAAELDVLLKEDPSLGRTESVELVAVEQAEARYADVRNGCVRLVVRLIVWDDGSIRDVKEQHVVVIDGGELTRERVKAAFTAWRDTLPRLFARVGQEIDTFMPHDLVQADLLELVKPQTREDFVAVLEKRLKLSPIAIASSE
ncbi:MAG: hypothetical protein QM817_13895 [Archangium sp.]